MTVHQARRRLEEALDELLALIRRGTGCEDGFRSALAAARTAFEAEEPHFARLEAEFPRFIAKMRGQHAEAEELAAALDDAFARGASAEERARLLRAFHAIVQHNVIEEDRELFSSLPPPAPIRGSERD